MGLIFMLTAIASFYVFGSYIWPWLIREGIAAAVYDNTILGWCGRRDRAYPSPDGAFVAIHRYEDCEGTFGPGSHMVLVRVPSDTRWLKAEYLFSTGERVLIRSVAWSDERTVLVTTNRPLRLSAEQVGQRYPVSLRLAFEGESQP
jgi:hypothetical protein